MRVQLLAASVFGRMMEVGEGGEVEGQQGGLYRDRAFSEFALHGGTMQWEDVGEPAAALPAPDSLQLPGPDLRDGRLCVVWHSKGEAPGDWPDLPILSPSVTITNL
jgi:hypothetical protein